MCVMLYACCLTVTCINETSYSTHHNALPQFGVQRSGQGGLDRTILAQRRRNLMNLYVTKIDDVVRDRSRSFVLTLFFFLFARV